MSNRTWLPAIAGLLSLISASPVLAAGPAAPVTPVTPLDAAPTAFINVHVIPMSEPGVLRDRTVIVDQGRISAIGPASELKPAPDARIIDGRGELYLIPGLCDMHIHFPPMPGVAPDAAAGSTGDPSWRAATLLLANGVTTARGLIGHETHLELRRRLAAGDLTGPTLYTAGPPLTVNSAANPEQAREAVKQQKSQGFDCIKSHRVVKLEVYEAIQAAAKEQAIPVTGHVDNEVGIDAAIKAHQQVEHLDACPAWLLKDPDLAMQFGQIPPPQFMDSFDEARIAPLARRLADAQIWMTPTQSLFSRIVDPRASIDELITRPELRFITPQARHSWAKQRADTLKSAGFTPDFADKFTGLRASIIRACNEAGVPLLAGSDSPQHFGVVGFALHEELKSLTEAGLTPWQALQTATANPARYLRSLPNEGSATGVPADFGTIQPGLRADLVLLEADPSADIINTRTIAGVMLRGRWLDRAALDAMLEQVAVSANAPPTPQG